MGSQILAYAAHEYGDRSVLLEIPSIESILTLSNTRTVGHAQTLNRFCTLNFVTVSPSKRLNRYTNIEAPRIKMFVFNVTSEREIPGKCSGFQHAPSRTRLSLHSESASEGKKAN